MTTLPYSSAAELSSGQRAGLFLATLLCCCAAVLWMDFTQDLTPALPSTWTTTADHIAQPAPLPRPQSLPPTQPYWQSATVQPGDSAIRVFNRLHIPYATQQHILNLGTMVTPLKHIQPGHRLFLLGSKKQPVLRIVYTFSTTDSLILEHLPSGEFKAHIEQAPLTQAMRYTSGTIKHSLYTAANKAGLSDKQIAELTHIFGWDIDFNKDVQPGDHFKVLFNTYSSHHHPVKTGPIEVAEFTHAGKTLRAIRFVNQQGDVHYYTPAGLSLQRPFIRNPVKYTRISSRFSLHRNHPILHHIRAHKGVDYAAPRGTPIKATGDGKIIFLGRKGGYGNTIMIRHNHAYTTVYAHMSRFAKHLAKRSHVKQGQIIGYVGSTGLATGPHLHYEFRINGIHRNPLSVKLPGARPIQQHYQAAFQAKRDRLLKQIQSLGEQNDGVIAL